MKIHHITVSAYAKSKDEAAKTREILKSILPADTPIEDVAHEPETEGEVFTKELYEVKSHLESQSQIKEFTSKIIRGLDEYDRTRTLERISDHVDEDCNLYLRLSKTEAAGGNIVLENKDSIHVRIKIAAFPAKRDAAIEVARRLIEDEIR